MRSDVPPGDLIFEGAFTLRYGEAMARRVRVMRAVAWLLLCAVMAGCASANGPSSRPAAAEPALRWWKGNLHTHTLWSDGDDFPEMVADWYKQHGYQFLALSDHNVLSEGQKWVKRSRIETPGRENAVARYEARFGNTWIERRGQPGPQEEFRLKPLQEFRPLFEEPGQFLMVQAEEISDGLDKLPVHVGAVNLLETIAPQHGQSIVEVIENNARAVEQQQAKTGQEMFAHLNHPNFKWGVTADQMAHAVSEKFFEIYNGHPGVNQLGDATRMSVEAMWDVANTIRMTELAAPPMLGLATDDSHRYHQAGMKHAAPGRGWIMVRARRLTPESLVRAIKAGDFYASTGVTLQDVRFDPATGRIELTIEGQKDVTYKTRFVGTRRADTGHPGVMLAEADGLRPQYTLKGDELYVRAVVISSRNHPLASFQGQKEQAWTQPVVAGK